MERYFKGHKAAITSVDFSPNGKQLGKFLFFFFDDRQTLYWSRTLPLVKPPGDSPRTNVGVEGDRRLGEPGAAGYSESQSGPEPGPPWSHRSRTAILSRTAFSWAWAGRQVSRTNH